MIDDRFRTVPQTQDLFMWRSLFPNLLRREVAMIRKDAFQSLGKYVVSFLMFIVERKQ